MAIRYLALEVTCNRGILNAHKEDRIVEISLRLLPCTHLQVLATLELFRRAPGVATMAAMSPRLSSGTAIVACAAMAVLYVGMLYIPCVLFRLPPARTISEHYLRRFACSIVASFLASAICFWLLPVRILGFLPNFVLKCRNATLLLSNSKE